MLLVSLDSSVFLQPATTFHFMFTWTKGKGDKDYSTKILISNHKFMSHTTDPCFIQLKTLSHYAVYPKTVNKYSADQDIRLYKNTLSLLKLAIGSCLKIV